MPQLQERFLGDHALIAEVATLFLNDLDAQIQQTSNMLDTKDYKKIYQASHTLKGSLLDLSAERAACIAEKIETGAKEQNEQIFLLFSKLVEECESVKTEIIKIISTLA